MSPAEKEQLALEAQRIKEDPTIRVAIAAIRMEALERLASIDPTATDDIREAQSIVRVSDGFLVTLEQMIVQGPRREGPTVA